PLLGSRLGHGPVALVLCHGFLGWHRKARQVRFAEALARWFTVYAFDFRGHGRSGGLCTLGDTELYDVDAVVRLARADGFERVVTVGASMGGVAAVRQAALRGGVDAVVAISTPAGWDGHVSPSVDRMRRLTSTERGRRIARRLGVRMSAEWDDPASPEEVAPLVSPTPLFVVHGRDDHFFDEEQAWRLYRAAEQPKRLLLAGRFGHAEDGFSPGLARMLAVRIHEALDEPVPVGAERRVPVGPGC
ncbi:MAG TPA: alpha/beta fold hydrolase, partial [Actinomycetota bacterium]|nr:alpha/beta fold hydrolase [Actinomycetota bacterium]